MLQTPMMSSLPLTDTLTSLMQEICQDGVAPPRGILRPTNVLPCLRGNVQDLVFVWHSHDDSSHGVIDHGLHTNNADYSAWSAARPTHPLALLDASARAAGWVFAINGLVDAATTPFVQNGDLLTRTTWGRPAPATPWDALLVRCPQLRHFMLPMVTPLMYAMPQSRDRPAPFASSGPRTATAARSLEHHRLRQSLEELCRLREETIGLPGDNRIGVWVFGADHAPLLLFVPGRITPTLTQVQDAVARIPGWNLQHVQL